VFERPLRAEEVAADVQIEQRGKDLGCRGEVVESDDVLADALASGRLSAVALDVFPTEPPDARHRLYADPRVICTPHSVGLTRRWNEEVFGSLARGVQSVLAGELPANVLNRRALIDG
jgi:D-3-phosphoglycerate dehydrogenase